MFLMLQIKDIYKEYRTGSLVQKALNHVSLNLRDNEFVAILGPSGSGKTTLLNVIGGLDRYDSGDLIINGVSTKKYKDRDWDSYRNHTIGFVFQSYNLIPHQNVLANVELALTISGISGRERKQRAIQALEKVGLGDQIYKKPNQMSGGQMQRVALARALVNDPDILLADEPTGALDTATSVQVMDLLKEVAKDRLVVMVTHNPDLAEKYATRIVNLKDGQITADSDPYIVDEKKLPAPVSKNLGKSSMSLWTSLELSFNNLRTKKARTILVAFAGSIGIIGIALIESLSNGVNVYINNVEEETLSEYPLEIDSESISMSSLFGSAAAAKTSNTVSSSSDTVKEIDTVTSMLSSAGTNDLKSLKKYLESGDTDIDSQANAVEYDYDVTPQIYRTTDDGYKQVNPDTTFSSLGIGSSSGSNSIMSSAMSTDIFSQLPANSSLYENQYDVKAGRWPEKDNEVVVVLSKSGGISDLVLYEIGLKDESELEEMVKQFAAEEDVAKTDSDTAYKSSDFLGITFKLVNSCDYYTYDETNKVWVNRSSDTEYMKNLVNNGEDVSVVGVVQPKADSSVSMLSSGISYPASMTESLMKNAASSDVVKAQQADTETDIFTGKQFGDESTSSEADLSSLFSVDSNAMANAIKFDTSALNIGSSASSLDLSDMNLSDYIDVSSLSSALNLSEDDVKKMLESVNVEVNQDAVNKTFSGLISGYQTYLNEHPEEEAELLNKAFGEFLKTEDVDSQIKTSIKSQLTKESVQSIVKEVVDSYGTYHTSNPTVELQTYLNTDEGLAAVNTAINNAIGKMTFSDVTSKVASDYGTYLSTNSGEISEIFQKTFSEYLSTDNAQKILSDGASSALNTEDIINQLSKTVSEKTNASSSAAAAAITDGMNRFSSDLTSRIASSYSNSLKNIASSMGSAISIDTSAFASAISINGDQQQLTSLLTQMMSTDSSTYKKNLTKLGYASEDNPSSITIYPKNFECKENIIDILDGYNDSMEKKGETDKVITYSDVVGTLMSSVTDIVNTISYVLIAFVAISLVVSSIMIGVITYISVLERQKEIGILRAIGASKKNISQVFNAETFITGLLAGLFGVGLTLLLLIPGNMIIKQFTDQPVVAALPWNVALILIALSVILTMLGGLIPAKKAAHSDPVKALRTD
jgi:ABC-type lipoprotein export system ATPase subunit/ABC-type antimicrobial peptide transport system permease subunit